jgi:hypothetical protein
MRFTEFKHIVSEEVLKTTSVARPGNSKYIANLINLIGQGAEIQVTIPKTTKTHKIVKTVKFLPAAAENLAAVWNPTGDKSEAPTPEQVVALFSAKLPAEDGVEYRLTHIEKTADISQKVGEQGEKTYTKYWNVGDIAEGIMSTAVLTKFEAEGAEITAAQVFENVQRMTQVKPGEIIFESSAFGKKIELRAILKVRIIEALIQSATDPDEFLKYDDAKEVYKLYSDCASYVNQSNSVKSALEKIKNASDEDIIQVTADGATQEAQHSTKADLWIALNNKKEKLLSIKTATVKHIGGVAGYEFHKIDSFLSSVLGFQLPDTIKSKFKLVPIQFSPKNPPVDEDGNLLFPDWKKGDPAPEGYAFHKDREPIAKKAQEYNINHGIKEAYKYCDAQLKTMLKSPEGEAALVQAVVDGIVHHATLGEDVRVVVISPNAKEAFKELEFGTAYRNAMANFNLVHELEQTENNGKKIFKLKIYGYPKTQVGKKVLSGASMLVMLRTYNQDVATRNVVEIGDLLKKITDVTELEQLDNKSSFDTKAKPVSQAELKKQAPATAVAPTAATVASITTPQAVSQATPTTFDATTTPTTAEPEVAPEEEPVAEEQGKWIWPHKDAVEDLRQRVANLLKR